MAVTLATLALAAPAQSAGLAKTTLTIRADGLDLSGKVKSPRSSCLGNRTVKVYKQAGSEQKPATDSVIGSDTSQRQGNVGEWSTGNSGISGKVYARTGKTAGCKGDSSETIRARR
ncbi:MAG: hypothetical protein AVDCRST_MAG22-1203 [uncultured Rubrobacteraceae bacterium]|uniref:DUF5666 domain-containing protein n=1 Tax=uncultured Rubrobacteraceae bacterium TaxID=349277 RepID=A0A6J4P726_9ACTN|nr:MAG: hypothetical protein AVDCRST_MAG22-1203 [uncultured Rubrobacteraceae bacterium]